MPLNHPLLKYFKYEHLPKELQKISKPFALVADGMVRSLPDNDQKNIALQKLLEAKDAAVRAAL